jgi:hypothetical protein
MTNSWQCDTCDRHFNTTKHRIELARKIRRGLNSYEYVSYRDLCTDCELYEKKWLKRCKRNHDA